MNTLLSKEKKDMSLKISLDKLINLKDLNL